MQKLQQLKAKEVSLVPQGANRRRFIVFKSAGKMTTHEELQKAITNADPDTMKRVGEVLDKHLTNDPEGNGVVRTAMQAISRIGASVKDKIPPPVMHALVDAIGFKITDDGKGDGEMGGAGATSVGESPTHGETVNMGMQNIPEEELKKAADCAQKAYDEHMEKLGYQKYPDAQVQMKSKSGKMGKMEKEKDDDEEDDDVEKSKMAEKVDKIFKAFEDVTKENSALKSEVAALTLVNKNRELVAKAASFTGLNLPQDTVVQTLSDAEKVGKESYDRVCKMFETMAEQTRVAKSFGGNLFGEMGSSLPGGAGGGVDSSWAKIEKAALAVVEKSGEKIEKAQAIANFLNTAEGTAMYAEYKNSRKDGI